MRNFLALLLVLVSVIVIIIPTLLVRGCTFGGSEIKRPRGSVIKVFNHQKKEILDMELEEYIKGVVAAEMPASFDMEALKAQAVVARTYVLYRLKKGYTVPEHPQAVVSTDYQSGQAWASRKELQKKWGLIGYLLNWKKISEAVEATRGQVLTYNGELIDALYHSNAGGKTEDPAYVWGNPVPYLKSVPSQYDLEAPDYRGEFIFSWKELDQKLGTNLTAGIEQIKELSKTAIAGAGEGLVEILEVSPTQRILQVRIDGFIFSGKDLRRKLNLPSTKCEIIPTAEGIKFVTYGKGHGVGMSQYGANGMAKYGSDYTEILSHYYPGTRLAQVKQN
ncbi:stage II sporulation protein D [Anoxybacter fermentans]|uniref:Stage II sporulation protein D n=1 Tax=Anoxybacter fermentans TaxID=1323375 RepID=A0A3Q9HRY7_9FIRM|nr:stage II sporulation protein D [Anoxybacter fermentans]AZR73984.1 stage II sporulation protein D [Anoxybacter fermentans]